MRRMQAAGRCALGSVQKISLQSHGFPAAPPPKKDFSNFSTRSFKGCLDFARHTHGSLQDMS